MSTAKRRKVAVATESRSPPSSVRGIAAFTKVSKAQVLSKAIHGKSDLLETNVSTQWASKRKFVLVDEVEIADENATSASEILSAALSITNRVVKPLPQQRNSKKPSQTPQKLITPPSSQETSTPTRSARDLLDKFALSSSPAKREAASEELPTEILDLINLHASFLTALSLHYAHNGTHSPADLRMLCPDVARAWGKRRVLLDDIRRTLGLLNISSVVSGLTLSDYGHGKICIESKGTTGKAGRVAMTLDERRLNEAFSKELQKLWKAKSQTGESTIAFIESLPLESITICSSLAKMSPLLAKGQRRLEDLRAGIVLQKQAENEKLKPAIVEDGTRKLTLLERLKAKQLQQASMPPPPSKAELGRKAALHRLEEVVSVLSQLTTSTSKGQARVSFTMPTVLGKLKDSFKTPISREEGDTCVRLLATEIAPEWLKVVKMGKVDAIVVNRDYRPSELDVKNRINRAVLV
jgi:hypothetical protein